MVQRFRMELDPAALAQPDRYKLLIGSIVPRPIAFVSTLGAGPGGGLPNLAPFSFFAGVASEPMSVLFCPANKGDGTMKDTLRNCLPPGHEEIAPASRGWAAQGQFVVNVVSRAIARQAAACAEELPYGESEFALSGLTMEPSARVRPARVRESPISFECETMQVIRLAPGVRAGGNIVVGRVVHVRVRDDLINERHHIDPALLDAVGRMGGLGYATTRDRFELPMGRGALGVEM